MVEISARRWEGRKLGVCERDFSASRACSSVRFVAMADDAIVDELPRAVLSKLPAVPNYPAPLPPSLEEEPVYVGPDLGSDSEDEDSAVETGDYETVHHEPLTEAQAMDSLKDMVRHVICGCALLHSFTLFAILTICFALENGHW